MVAVQTPQLGVADRKNRSRPGSVIQQRHLSEYVTGPRSLEHDPFALIVHYEDLYFAGTDDIERVAGISKIEDGLAGGIPQQVDAFGERGPLGVAQLAQVRDFLQNGWICGHATTLQHWVVAQAF